MTKISIILVLYSHADLGIRLVRDQCHTPINISQYFSLEFPWDKQGSSSYTVLEIVAHGHIRNYEPIPIVGGECGCMIVKMIG